MEMGAVVHPWQKINVEGFQVFVFSGSVGVLAGIYWCGIFCLVGIFCFFLNTMMLMFKC